MDSDLNGQLPPGQARGDPRRFEPVGEGSRRRSERVVSEELGDPRHESDVGREVPILPGVDRRRVRAEPFGDIRLTEAQIQPPGSNVVTKRLQLGGIGGILCFSST